MAVLQSNIERLTVSLVESGYEPELFKSAFNAWQNFEHMQASTIVEEESDEEGEEKRKGGMVITGSKRAANLLPDNIWII
jgi:hypothetical protein